MDMKLMVVDDNRRVRKVITAMVGDLSDEIVEFDNGSHALAGYAECLPDWVLMDLVMPGIDGIEATRRIISSFPKARIIIVTSHESPAMREAATLAGACGYVLKENLGELRGLIGQSCPPE
jgi:CheY-like chemotaxis protein